MATLGPESSTNSDPKYQRIYEHFREQILTGKLAPGAVLPTHVEIRDQFLAGPMTVQRALSRLASDGFTQARRGAGTRVADFPPHLCRYALVFPEVPVSSRQYSRFYQTLLLEAKAFEPDGSRRIISFLGVDGHADSEDQQRLSYEVKSRRLAGIIFASNPVALTNTGLLNDTSTPKVAIMSGRPRPEYGCVNFDNMALVDKAMRHLRQMGRRRVAVVMGPDTTPASDFMESLRAAIAGAGLETRPYWLGRFSLTTPIGARDFMHLMFQPHQKDRPDALFINDDNLTEQALLGLVAAGVSASTPLSIVTHWNFPWPITPPLPIFRVGYDARQVLWQCVGALNEIARTGPIPAARVVQPVTELELLTDEQLMESSLPPGIAAVDR